MMALLFLLYLVAVVLALFDREKPSLIVFSLAMVVSIYWFIHHASSVLTIEL